MHVQESLLPLVLGQYLCCGKTAYNYLQILMEHGYIGCLKVYTVPPSDFALEDFSEEFGNYGLAKIMMGLKPRNKKLTPDAVVSAHDEEGSVLNRYGYDEISDTLKELSDLGFLKESDRPLVGAWYFTTEDGLSLLNEVLNE